MQVPILSGRPGRLALRASCVLAVAAAAAFAGACAKGVDQDPEVEVVDADAGSVFPDAAPPAPDASKAKPADGGSNREDPEPSPDAQPSDAKLNPQPDTSTPADTGPLPNPTGDCFRISEYIEAGSTKVLEMWNCGSAPLALGNYLLCLESNAATTCTSWIGLDGTLAPNETFVVCGTGFTHASCEASSGVVNFNGNDRVAIFRDTNANGTVERGTDVVVDAIGRLGAEPPTGVAPASAMPWEDTGLRRSTCAAYAGATDFNVSAYYTANDATILTHLGVAPSVTCP